VRGVAIGSLNGNNTALNGEYLAEDGLAEATGGRAYHSGNDLGSAIADAAEHGSRYYTLSYAPTNVKWDGRLRQIRIQAERSGDHLAYRHSYFAFEDPPGPKGDKSDPVIEALANKLEHGAPMARELFFEVHVHRLDTPEAAAGANDAAGASIAMRKRRCLRHWPSTTGSTWTTMALPTENSRLRIWSLWPWRMTPQGAF
jgi:hypothetical protein